MIALVLDTETTALVANRTMADSWLPEIIEFYAELVDLASENNIAYLHHFIKPMRPISPDITKITGIDDAMVADKPNFKKLAPDIIEMIEDASVIIAHNAHFDRECLDIEAQRIGLEIRWPRTICTVEQSIFYTGNRLTLSQLHEFLFKEKFADAHRASSDAKALIRCCREMFRRGDL
jgi:DNA polymerase-3 subunit epsilon